MLTGHICVLHITGCENNKTVAQLIEPKDDLVTVDHLPCSKSWHSEVSGVANLAGKDAVDIKNEFHHIKIHSLYLSTVQMSYVVTLITKAIDTTSNRYQPLWLRCWRGDISIFFTKKLNSSSYNDCACLLLLYLSDSAVTITATESSVSTRLFSICTGHNSLSRIRSKLVHSMTVMLLGLWSRMVATVPQEMFQSPTFWA